MQIITDYQIVTAKMTDTIESFGNTVDALVKKGWQPFGTPFIILDQRWQQINQAMVKYVKPKHIEMKDSLENTDMSPPTKVDASGRATYLKLDKMSDDIKE